MFHYFAPNSMGRKENNPYSNSSAAITAINKQFAIAFYMQIRCQPGKKEETRERVTFFWQRLCDIILVWLRFVSIIIQICE